MIVHQIIQTKKLFIKAYKKMSTKDLEKNEMLVDKLYSVLKKHLNLFEKLSLK